MPDRREEGANTSAEISSDVAHKRYRQDETGHLKMREAVIRHPGEKHIQRLRQYLTWIEGELEAGDNEQALIYLEQMEPWTYQLKKSITDALAR